MQTQQHTSHIFSQLKIILKWWSLRHMAKQDPLFLFMYIRCHQQNLIKMLSSLATVFGHEICYTSLRCIVWKLKILCLCAICNTFSKRHFVLWVFKVLFAQWKLSNEEETLDMKNLPALIKQGNTQWLSAIVNRKVK